MLVLFVNGKFFFIEVTMGVGEIEIRLLRGGQGAILHLLHLPRNPFNKS